MINKKQKIINFLKRNGRSSTTRIASAIKSDKWMAEQYLEALESEKKIIREKETHATYWKLFDSSLNDIERGTKENE